MILSVDGGHRAIKYSRISGVKKEIYNEGTISLESNISLG
jgi:prohibitin 2